MIVRVAFAAALCCIPLLLLPVIGTAPLLLHNTGASMPSGWYLRAYFATVRTGVVVVRKDPPGFKLRWLMKRVEGVAGDRYCWHPELGTHTIGDRPMPPPAPEGIAMGIPIWKGCRELESDEIVGYGQSADSYDARWFGPIKISQLWGIYRPVWISG